MFNIICEIWFCCDLSKCMRYIEVVFVFCEFKQGQYCRFHLQVMLTVVPFGFKAKYSVHILLLSACCGLYYKITIIYRYNNFKLVYNRQYFKDCFAHLDGTVVLLLKTVYSPNAIGLLLISDKFILWLFSCFMLMKVYVIIFTKQTTHEIA